MYLLIKITSMIFFWDWIIWKKKNNLEAYWFGGHRPKSWGSCPSVGPDCSNIEKAKTDFWQKYWEIIRYRKFFWGYYCYFRPCPRCMIGFWNWGLRKEKTQFFFLCLEYKKKRNIFLKKRNTFLKERKIRKNWFIPYLILQMNLPIFYT